MLLSAPACVASQSMSRCPAASRSRREARSGRRLAAVAARATAAPGGGGARQAAAPPSSRAAKQQQLVSALLEATRKEVVQGWLADLVLPLVPSADPTADLAPPPPTRPAQALAGPEGRFVRVDGVGLHYREALPGGNGSSGSSSNDSSGSGGSGGASSAVGSDRPAILLVHGFNGSTFSWRAQMQALADATGCRVLAYDRPPFGLAERPLSWGGPGDELAYDPYSLEGQGRMAQGLLDALGVRSVVAVGHSAGALVCMELALRAPRRVAGLGFVAPALPTTPERSFQRRAGLGQQLRFLATRALLSDDRAGLRYVRRQLLKRRDEVAAGRGGLASVDDSESEQDVIDGYLLPLQAPDWDRGALLNLRAFSLPPAYDYNALTAPVALVVGSEDGALTEAARGLEGLLRARPAGATRFAELQGVGHVVADEAPALLNRLLADFVLEEVLQAGQRQQRQ